MIGDVITRTLEEIYAFAVDVRGPDECWPWTRSTDREGHGQYCVKRADGKWVPRKAHRIVFELATGAEPVNQVLHRCNFEPCCNPAHLYDGTPADNASDRTIVGNQRSRPVITFEQAQEIRRIHDGSIAHLRALTVQYGIGTRALANILSGRSWRVDADGNPLPRRTA